MDDQITHDEIQTYGCNVPCRSTSESDIMYEVDSDDEDELFIGPLLFKIFTMFKIYTHQKTQ